MKSVLFLLAATLLLSLAPAALNAKGTTAVGIYAVIDQVTFDRDGDSPTLVRISGTFIVPVPMSSGDYKAPQRGYLYFRVPPGAEEAARKEWSELKTLAGTGQVVGFAYYWTPNPSDPWGNPHRSLEVKVRAEGDATPPEVYPLAHPKGIVKAHNGDSFDEQIAARLRKE